jgi:hypothetical protein
MCAHGSGQVRPEEQPFLKLEMSLSLYRMPDGQSKSKGQIKLPCPSVYAPTSALRSLSSVALSSAPATKTLSRLAIETATTPHFSQTLSSTFLVEATNPISSTFLREAIGRKEDSVLLRKCELRSQVLFVCVRVMRVDRLFPLRKI